MQQVGGSMSVKVRVYEVAKQLNLDPKAVVGLFQAIGIPDVRNHMSSVEPEAVERVKRHLEKQRTHDVVEEKIRPGVVKRRAIAKPGAPPPSSTSLPAAAPSSRVLDRGDDVMTHAPSRTSVEHNGNGHAQPVEARDRESARLPSVRELPDVPEVAEARKSVRELEVPPAPPSVPRERKSTREVARVDVPEAPVSEARPPVPPPASSKRIEHVEEAPPVAAAAPVEIEARPPVAPPVREEVAPEPAPAAPAEAPAPAMRPSSAPKTGVEYWGGRPGVPMAPPAMTRGSSLSASNMPRRVQYDPRAGVTTAPGRSNVRAPGQQGGRPMMGRGGPGNRRGMQIPMRKPSGIVSTQEMSAHKKVIRIEENITLQGMAQKLSLKSTELLMKLLGMGMTGVHINTTLDADTAKILASEFGWEVEDVAKSEEEAIAAARGEEDAPKEAATVDVDQLTRSPVVTVMGHVDHGKTSLLDKIRKANVAGGEAGGITQHIGAYKVSTPSGMIVFLDTPGHEAFTQMRARGASVTDLVILVVAADDGVMPQTKEAIAHAKSAKVPIIVAINKIDKQGADLERVKRELAESGLQPEEWGGDTMFVPVSALTGEGIPFLLENIAVQAEVLELKANAKQAASGTVLEALLDRGRGPVARVLVQDGTLRVGDFVLAGPGFGKVRAMTNEHGKQVHEAGPSTPVEILGLSEVPGAGDPMHAVKDPKKAQEIAESRKGKMAKSLIPATAKVSLEELSKRMSDASQQELRVIIKGDVQGSVEAVAEALAKLSCEKVRLSIIHAGVGAITEGDINLAIASRSIVLGFNVRPAGKATSLADQEKIEIRLYSIIYNAVDDVKGAMEGLLPPTLVEKANGKAEVRQTFKVRGQVIAGSFVIQGKVTRSAKARVVRDGNILWDGKMSALKRFKDDVKDVLEGFECGISLDGFNDLKEKDIIESYEIDEIKQRL
jgi:translation initiation factor IF-2